MMDIYHVYELEKQLLQESEMQLYRTTGHGFSDREYYQKIREICDGIGL